MKRCIIIMTMMVMIIASTFADWQTNFDKAKAKARSEHKYMLLNFSGSDWCIPCVRTKKEIFNNNYFSSFADSNLVLMNADFPRLKKNQLSKDEVKQNNALAEQYDKKGAFPLTILLTPNGEVVKQWEGYPGVTAEQFVDQIKKAACAAK